MFMTTHTRTHTDRYSRNEGSLLQPDLNIQTNSHWFHSSDPFSVAPARALPPGGALVGMFAASGL